jgi:hypothetical protein
MPAELLFIVGAVWTIFVVVFTVNALALPEGKRVNASFAIFFALGTVGLWSWFIAAVNCPFEIESEEVYLVVEVGDVQYVQVNKEMRNINSMFGRRFEVGQKIKYAVYKRGPYLGVSFLRADTPGSPYYKYSIVDEKAEKQ